MVSSRLCSYNSVPLGGVIDYFRKATGKSNPAEAGLISLNASSNKETVNRVLMLNLDAYTFWQGIDSEGWIEFDFKRNRLNITGYTLNCFSFEYLREWKVNASIDRINWKDIDHKTLSAAPEGNGKISKYFQVDTPFFARYIRIIRIGKRFHEQYQYNFILRAVDFFGKFYSWRDLNRISRLRRFCEFYIHNFIMTFLLSS